MSPRDWIRMAERKEKEAKKLLQEAQAFRQMAETKRGKRDDCELPFHRETMAGLNSLAIRPGVTR